MTLIRVLAFSVFVLLIYTAFANIVPQVQSNPPEEEVAPVAGEIDMTGMVAWGERLFSGKGTCTLCHNDLGRAPDLLAIDLQAELTERIHDANYDGAAKGLSGAEAAAAYLHESQVDPSAYVVAGFGKKGSNDTVSPMPAVNAAPILLSSAEINALTAFMQDRAGFEPTVDLPGAGDTPVVDDEAEPEAPAANGVQAIEKFSCAACHDLEGSEAEGGPKLSESAARLGRDGLRHAILVPNGELAAGFEADVMPQDYGAQMRASELELIVDYLMGLKAGGTE